MTYAIVLSFDDDSSFPIKQVFKKFCEEKISSILYEINMKPHITLSIYESIDAQTAKDRLFLFCIEIQISSIGYFPSEESVLFLNPKATNELLNIQQKIFSLFKDFEAEISPITWVPHCTLGINLQKEAIAKAIDIIKEDILMTKEKPFYIQATTISLVKFERETLKIDYWIDYPLKG